MTEVHMEQKLHTAIWKAKYEVTGEWKLDSF